MDIAEKAETNVDAVLAGDLIESAYELTDTELVPADELTPSDEFPKYGDFAPAEEFSPYDGTPRGECHIEIPASLAEWLVENGLGTGDRFEVKRSEKRDGRWQFEVQIVDK